MWPVADWRIQLFGFTYLPPNTIERFFNVRFLTKTFSELFWNPFIIYLSKCAIKQSHSSIYAAFVDLPICLRRVVAICFRHRVYITITFLTWVNLYTHVKHMQIPGYVVGLSYMRVDGLMSIVYTHTSLEKTFSYYLSLNCELLPFSLL